jgi:hypothetical protein
VLARDVVAEPNLVSRDIVLVRAGQTADILFDATSPGVWMSHCHVAEHMQSGMMFSFNVARDLGRRRLRPGRGDERLSRPGGGSRPPICDLGPVLRKVELRERVQGCRGE